MKTSEIVKWVDKQKAKGLDTDEIIIKFEKLTNKKKNGSNRRKNNR